MQMEAATLNTSFTLKLRKKSNFSVNRTYFFIANVLNTRNNIYAKTQAINASVYANLIGTMRRHENKMFAFHCFPFEHIQISINKFYFILI